MEEITCFCKNISKSEIERAILKGAHTLKDIQDATGACTGNQCKELNPKGRCCSVEIATMLNDGKNGQKPCCCCS
jgi:bacterioferritin-associated ferredoxin